MSSPHPVNIIQVQKNLQDFARQLIIAKSGDYDALDPVTQESKSVEILSIFFTFVEEVLESTTDTQLQAQWQAYKSSNYDFQVYTDSKQLSQAMDQIIAKFLSL